MVIDLVATRREQTQALAEQQKAQDKEETKYFLQCLLSATGIFVTLITLYFVGYAFL